MFARPLFSLLREGFEEVRVDGELVVSQGERIVYQTGEAPGQWPARSLLKPFQYLATGLSPPRGRHVAALGSISATREQAIELARWYAKKSELLGKVKIAPAYPMDEAHRAMLRASDGPPSVLYHPCFSKHAAIVEACAQEDWDEASYTSTDHPFHARLCETVDSLLGEPAPGRPPAARDGGSRRAAVVDGCLLPSLVLGTDELCRLYQKLASAPAGSPLASVAAAMLEAPHWIGGPGRLDTRIMQANPGRVIAKEGADGLLALGVLASPGNDALGVVLKLAAGYQPRLAALALAPLLAALGLVAPEEPTPGQTVVHHYQPLREESSGLLDVSPAVGHQIAVFPGDVPFRREMTSDAWAESGIAVSCIHTTVHVGAHADAPNHVDAAGPGIDAVDLSRYLGLCQVVAVTTPRGSTIVPAELGEVALRAPRVLLKTGSFPDARHFNEDFVACSAELIEWLASRGVLLVGIDTPSIDPCHSKSLPAHHAAIAARMAILEGIVLGAAPAGLYELIALPLKLEGADASPVRAILRPHR